MPAHKITSLKTEDGDTYLVTSQRDPARSYGMQFHTTFTDEAAKIARTVSSGATLRLFIVLPQLLTYNSWRRLDQVKLGADLGMNNSTISRALKELVELEVIERQGKGPVVEWKLTPNFGWRGNVESFHNERAKRSKSAPGGPAGADEDRIIYSSGNGSGISEAGTSTELVNLHPVTRQRNLRLLTPINSEPPEPSAA
jgi:hypothetical protein